MSVHVCDLKRKCRVHSQEWVSMHVSACLVQMRQTHADTSGNEAVVKLPWSIMADMFFTSRERHVWCIPLGTICFLPLLIKQGKRRLDAKRKHKTPKPKPFNGQDRSFSARRMNSAFCPALCTKQGYIGPAFKIFVTWGFKKRCWSLGRANLRTIEAFHSEKLNRSLWRWSHNALEMIPCWFPDHEAH
jgi:hypothetical protein